jgi:hypothetical protein
VIAVGKGSDAEAEQYVCGIYGFAMTELGECPRYRLQVAETAKGRRQRQQREDLFKQIDEIVEDIWGDADGTRDSD